MGRGSARAVVIQGAIDTIGKRGQPWDLQCLTEFGSVSESHVITRVAMKARPGTGSFQGCIITGIADAACDLDRTRLGRRTRRARLACAVHASAIGPAGTGCALSYTRRTASVVAHANIARGARGALLIPACAVLTGSARSALGVPDTVATSVPETRVARWA